jgi:cation diffusion facilitator family transporter
VQRVPQHAVTIGPHEHPGVADVHLRSERNTRRVIALTAITMVAEIAAGSLFNSMALLADGWHMGSHASALGITAFAYRYARRHADNARFAFGTWKVGALGGFASAVVLGLVAVLLLWESVQRFTAPLPIEFNEAIAVATLGLLVNIASAAMLNQGGHDHGDGAHTHGDHNLRAAYLHVLTDALTSVLAIAALLVGKFLGWVWMDPLTGIIGAVVISLWSVGLVRDTSRVLLDGDVDPEIGERLRQAIESDADTRVVDLHLWRLGPHGLSAIIAVATHDPRPPEYYKDLVADVGLTHVTIEVNRCPGDECAVVFAPGAAPS